MQKCRPLFEYSVFIGKVKKYRIEMEQLNAAVHRAVEECIRENILKDILEKHRREVYDMCLTEFDEQKYEDIVKEEAREEGLREGREEGLQERYRKESVKVRKIIRGRNCRMYRASAGNSSGVEKKNGTVILQSIGIA